MSPCCNKRLAGAPVHINDVKVGDTGPKGEPVTCRVPVGTWRCGSAGLTTGFVMVTASPDEDSAVVPEDKVDATIVTDGAIFVYLQKNEVDEDDLGTPRNASSQDASTWPSAGKTSSSLIEDPMFSGLSDSTFFRNVVPDDARQWHSEIRLGATCRQDRSSLRSVQGDQVSQRLRPPKANFRMTFRKGSCSDPRSVFY